MNAVLGLMSKGLGTQQNLDDLVAGVTSHTRKLKDLVAALASNTRKLEDLVAAGSLSCEILR